ncbi:GcrA cell cycle regulator [Sinorhizobium meliloti]|nr:GcrA cell cycle regulator [Sinorhizobium meliloti]MQW59640.1 GcrA cell cycle regulator [Sinorhizobium meliloti]MQX93141.1 GcrA cell cycle regulator [Sinorhizobium meliloti]
MLLLLRLDRFDLSRDLAPVRHLLGTDAIQHRIIDLEASAKLWSDGPSALQIASILVSRNVVIAWHIATVTGSHRARSGSWRFRWAADTSTRRPPERTLEPKPEPEIPATAYDAERLTHAKRLHELTAGECC